MSNGLLDRKFLKKIAYKIKKKPAYVNVLVSQKANKHKITSRAALALLAEEKNIGTGVYLKKLEPSERDEVRNVLSSMIKPNGNNGSKAKPSIQMKIKVTPQQVLRNSIEFLIQDSELKVRCKDILLAKTNFDRPVNQATLVLEDRIRRKVKPPKALVGVSLVSYAFKSDLSQTILKVSDNSDIQDGYTQIFRGVFLAFRNSTHHHVTNSITLEEAIKICGFIDVLLQVVDKSIKNEQIAPKN